MKAIYEWRGKKYEIACEALSEGAYRLRWDEESMDCTVRQLVAGGWLIRRGDQTEAADLVWGTNLYAASHQTAERVAFFVGAR